MILGTHTGATLGIGDTITSVQHHNRTWHLVWTIYKQVADELGVYFPDQYGYAYPIEYDYSGYIVEAPIATRGVCNLSAYVALEQMNVAYQYLPKSASLEDRLAIRKEYIRNMALAYFQPRETDRCELISDSFVVVGHATGNNSDLINFSDPINFFAHKQKHRDWIM